MTATCLPMMGHLYDTNIEHHLAVLLPYNIAVIKVLKTVASLR